jgi:hypothetical protein
LIDVAKSGAQGLEKVLKILAKWMGANPDEVKVKPNTEFANSQIEGGELVAIMSAKSMGAPFSQQSIHTYGRERGLTRLTYEQEMALIDNEEVVIPPSAGSSDPEPPPSTGSPS